MREAKPGDVVRLTDLADGHEPGYCIFLGHDADSVTLCPLGEDDAGQVCTTDEEFRLPLRFAQSLKRTGLSVDDAGSGDGP